MEISLFGVLRWLGQYTRTLSVSLMELFGEEPQQDKSAKRRRGPVPQWQQHIEAIAKLPRSRQQFVAAMLRNTLGEGAPQ